MPKRKPLGWPRYMVAKSLKSGVSYYWNPPSWATQAGCPLTGEALGADYGSAKARCDDVLNPTLDSWRTSGATDSVPERIVFGSFDWAVSLYKKNPKYIDLPADTRSSYDRALNLVSAYVLKDGRRFGGLLLASIRPGVADRLYAKLRVRPDGKPRKRMSILAMRIAQRAWNVAFRERPDAVPMVNPFAKMGLSYQATPTRPVTYDELMRFVNAADQDDQPSIGTAAMIAFFWLQREIDILHRLSWSHYRPAENPTVVRIFHNKTKEIVDLPLYDEDGTALWPELMERLDTAQRHGTLICTRDRPDKRRKVHLPWTQKNFQHVVADIRSDAKIDTAAKFMGLRHGGNTEGGNAGLTDAQLRALSGHRSPNMTIIYTRQTMQQRRQGARKRLDARTKGGKLSE